MRARCAATPHRRPALAAPVSCRYSHPMEFDLLVLGDVNPDLVLRGGDISPAFGQAERLVDEAALTVGGSGAIMACGAARLGLRVAIVGVVGDDLFGSFMREQLVGRGVDIRGLAVDPEPARRGHRGALHARRPRDPHRARHDRRPASGRWSTRDLLRSARHVHVELLLPAARPGPGPAAAVRRCARRGRDHLGRPELGSERRMGRRAAGAAPRGRRAACPTRSRPRGSRTRRTSRPRSRALRARGPVVAVKAGERGAVALGPGERCAGRGDPRVGRRHHGRR